jgi:uncharacterized protein YukE
MALISLSIPQARQTASTFDRSSTDLDNLYAHLQQQWSTLSANWQGYSKHETEADVHTLMNRGGQVAQLTRERGVKVTQIADRFQAVDENEPLAVTGMVWAAAAAMLASAPIPQIVPIPVQPPQQPEPPSLPASVQDLRDEIKAAAKDGATPELIAAILEDEANRRDPLDTAGDLIARTYILYEGDLEKLDGTLLQIAGKPIDDISLGRSQMKASTLIDLVDRGYLPKPDNWNNDKLDVALGLLLDDKKAPQLVSAYINQITDHWKPQVDLTNRPDIIGTLYSLGLDGTHGVNSNPTSNERGQGISDSAQRMEESF